MNTTAHENIKLIKRFYRYARKGDSDNAHAFLSSDIEFRERTPSLGSSDKHTGAAAVLAEALGPIDKSVLDYRLHIKKVFAVSDYVIVLASVRGLVIETAHDLNGPVAHIWTLRDGKAVCLEVIHDTDSWCQTVVEPVPVAA